MEYIEKRLELSRLVFLMAEFSRENNLTMWAREQYDSPNIHEFIFITSAIYGGIGIWKIVVNLDEWNADVTDTICRITGHLVEQEPIRLNYDDELARHIF